MPESCNLPVVNGSALALQGQTLAQALADLRTPALVTDVVPTWDVTGGKRRHPVRSGGSQAGRIHTGTVSARSYSIGPRS